MSDERIEKGFSIELGPELDDPVTRQWAEYEDDLPDSVEPMKSDPHRRTQTGFHRIERREAKLPKSQRRQPPDTRFVKYEK